MDRTSMEGSVDGLLPSIIEDGSRRQSDPKDELSSIIEYQRKVCASPPKARCTVARCPPSP